MRYERMVFCSQACPGSSDNMQLNGSLRSLKHLRASHTRPALGEIARSPFGKNVIMVECIMVKQ